MNAVEANKLIRELEEAVKPVPVPIDGMLTAISRRREIDVTKFDKNLSKYDPEYDSENCLYKGKKCSMRGYLTKKFGKDIAILFGRLLA